MKKPITLSVLAIAFCLSFQNHPLLPQAPKDVEMECKLIVKKNKLTATETPEGQVEIKNTGKKEFIMIYNTNPWEFLNLEVRDATGKNISPGTYGGRFSPSTFTPERTLILKAGETYRAPVNIFGNASMEDRMKPGVYHITAVFEYNNLTAVGKSIDVTIVPE